MSHLDEGQIHALLDNELDANERRTVEEHLKACLACREAVEVAKRFLAEADRLVGVLEPPPATRPTALGANPRRVPLLQRYQWAAWAATLVLAVGLGYYGSEVGTKRMTPAATPPVEMIETAKEKGSASEDPPANAVSPAPGTAKSQPTMPSSPVAGAVANRKLVAPSRESVADAEAKDEAQSQMDPRGYNPAAKVAALPDTLERRRNEQAAGQGLRQDKPAEPAGRLAEVPMAPPRTVSTEIHNPPFQHTTLEEAVRALGGSVLLIDGMEPAEVQTGPGTALMGADPARPIVRVIYLDPPGRQLWLDQQRMTENDVTSGVERAQQKESFLEGDTLFVREGIGASTLRWESQSSFRLALTGYLPVDSLRAFSRRVR